MHRLTPFIHFAFLGKAANGFFLILLFSSNTIAENAYSSFTYNIVGQGKDIILIPGLMSDSRVWLKTAEVLSKKNRIHLINVAGFGSTPTSSNTNTMNKLQIELGDYVSKLDKPILIGHSLGGFLALSLAINNPDNIESVISVDGLPFIGPIFTGNPNTQLSDISVHANYIKNHYAKLSREGLRNEISRGLEIQATTEGAKKLVFEMSSLSDTKTAGNMMHSVMTTDLRSSLHEIDIKVMMLGASGAMPNKAAKDQLEALYKNQFKLLPSSKVLINRNARHFIMLDDLDWLLEHVNDFIEVKPS